MFPAQPNQSLIDGLAVLQAIASSREALGTRELGRMLGLEPTRVSRLLGTLAGLGLAHKTPSRKYAAGAGVHVLAAQALYGSGLLRHALPHLEALHDTGCQVALGVLWRAQVCYLYHGGPGVSSAEAMGRTGLYPAEQSGIGHVLLAALDEAERELVLPTRHSRLDRALARAAKQNWSYLPASKQRGNATVAIGIGDTPVAALALAGDIKAAEARAHVPRLRRISAEISQKLVH